jgi:hypothetical protein
MMTRDSHCQGKHFAARLIEETFSSRHCESSRPGSKSSAFLAKTQSFAKRTKITLQGERNEKPGEFKSPG